MGNGTSEHLSSRRIRPSLQSFDTAIDVVRAPEPTKPHSHHSSDGIDWTDRGHGHRLAGESDAELGYEAPSVRIFD
jgi:hypothetical protein